MGDSEGRRAVGGDGDIDAAGKDARRGERSSSGFGGEIGACIFDLNFVKSMPLSLSHANPLQVQGTIQVNNGP